METGGPAMQRAAGLVELPALLGDVPLAEVLAGAGVTPADLRPDAFIPYAAFLDILERAARLTGREDLGLRLGLRQTLAVLGPVGALMRLAPTLGTAWSDFAAFQIANSTGSAVYLHRTREDFVVAYGIYAGPVSPQMHDAVIGVACMLMRELTGGRVGPTEIMTMRPRPRDPGPWTRLADCPVRFGESQTGLVLPSGAFGFPLPGADRRAHAAAFAALSAKLASTPSGRARQVAHALRPLMLDGRSGMAEVAGELGTTPRTLRRALEREGTRFEAIRDEVRFAAARELLTLTALPVGEIAMTLGFSTHGAFTEAFRRWSGTSPVAWRAERRKHSP